jgi:3-isopropylmalate dehydrogenase
MSEQKKIVLLPGDGIGKEVCAQAVNLLKALQEPLGMNFEFEEQLVGGAALEAYGIPLKDETLERCKNADAVLLGAVGSPKFDNNPSHLRPEKALLGLRAGLGVYCNLRPAKLYDVLIDASSLKPEIVRGIDILVVRELTGGIYFGEPAERYVENGNRKAVNSMIYSEEEVRRIAKKAFEFARMRYKKVTSVDKANVLVVSQLWREVVEEVAKQYPEIKLEHMLVDNCAMQLVRNPRQFDVLLTSNMFGDILSDEASMLTGSLGMLPSASIGDGPSLFEPVHGSAPDIAGQDKANPIAMLNSVAMMLQYSFKQQSLALAIENSIAEILQSGYHTADLNFSTGKTVGTEEMASLIIKKTLERLSK